VKDEADALNVENDEECSTALVTGGVVECDSDTVHVVEDTSCEDGQRNNTQDQDVKATVDNVEVESEKTQPAVCDDSSRNEDPGDSAKTTRKIDWDALEKPKPKLSGGDAEFSQVFNKVVKQKSAAGSKDSQHTTQRTYLSRTDLLVSSELRSNAAGRHFPSKTSKVSGKTEAERPNTLQLSSSTADEQVDTGKSVVSTERQTESVEVQETAVSSMSCTQSSPCTRLSLAAKESSVMSKTKPEADDTTLTSVASVTESRDADTKLSSTGEIKLHVEGTRSLSSGKESSATTKKMTPCDEDMHLPPGKTSPAVTKRKPLSEDTKISSPSKDYTAVTKTKPQNEDAKISSGKESPAITMTKPQNEDTRISSPGKESPAVAKRKPLSEDTKISSPGKESPAVAKRKPRVEDESQSSSAKESPATTKTKEHNADISVKPLVEDVSTESRTKSVRNPQTDTNKVSPAQLQKKGSYQMHKANVEDSSSDVTSREPETCTTEGAEVTDSSSPSAGRTMFIKKHSQTSVKLPHTNPPDTDRPIKATSPGKESLAVTQTKPLSEDTKMSSPGKESPAVTKRKPVTDPPPTNTPVGDSADNKALLPAEVTSPCNSAATLDVDTNDRHLVEQAATSTDISSSTCEPQMKQQETGSKDQNTVEAGQASETLADSSMAKSVPSQQKKFVPRRSNARVQPSETTNEEPAWVKAAKRKSHQWNEGRAEEFDKKPEKADTEDDDKVCCYYLPH